LLHGPIVDGELRNWSKNKMDLMAKIAGVNFLGMGVI
jgi:hypothetical protein